MSVFSSIKNFFKKTFGGGSSSRGTTRRASRVSNYGGGGSRSYSDYSSGGYRSDYEDRKKREARQRKEQKKKQDSVTNALASISKRTDALASGRSSSVASSATHATAGQGTARVLAKINEKGKKAPPDPKQKRLETTKTLKQIADDTKRSRADFNKATGNKYNVDKRGSEARRAQKSQAYDVKAEKYETEKHPIATSFGRGALSGVTFGGSEVLAQTSKNRKKSGAEAYYQKNKSGKAELAGELAGSLVGFGLTGEASARAVGKVAPRAVKNLGTRGAEKLASSSAIRRAAEKEAIKRFGREGATKEIINQIARRRAATAMTELGKDAAINLTTGLASDITHSALDSDNLADFAKNMGRNAAINVALGGATSLVPAFRVGKRFDDAIGGAVKNADDAVEGAVKKSDEAVDALTPLKRSGEADNVKASLNRPRRTDVVMPEVRPTEVTPQAVEEAPIRRGYHAGDGGKAEWYGNQAGSRRDTGHYGTGTYFAGSQDILSREGYGNRPLNEIDFSNYNLYRPQDTDQGFRVHDRLKQINRGSDDMDGLAKKFSLNRESSARMLDELDNAETIDDLEAIARRVYSDEELSDIEMSARELLGEWQAQNARVATKPDVLNEDTIDDLIMEDIDFSDINGLESYLRKAEARARETPIEDATFEHAYFNELESTLREDLTKIHENGGEFDEWIDDVANDLGVSREQVENALERTREKVNSYGKNSGFLKEDSASTIFMKELGYEGVDVTGLEGLDNTEFGSVIYDLRPEDMRQIREGKPRKAEPPSIREEAPKAEPPQANGGEVKAAQNSPLRQTDEAVQQAAAMRSSDSVLGRSESVPPRQSIEAGEASYGGLPIRYEPNMHAEARNMDTEIRVSSKFFDYDEATQRHILNHEVSHGWSDDMMAEHAGDWQEFASKFVKEKEVPPTSQAYQNGQRTYWEGIYGDIGATSLSESVTRAITEYLDDPDALMRRSPEAFEAVSEFVARRSGQSVGDAISPQTIQDEAAQIVKEDFERNNPSSEMPRADEDPSQFAQINEGMAGIDAEAERQAQRRMPQTEEERLATKIEEKETGRKMTNEEISARNENRERLKLKEQEVKPRKMPKGERLTSKVAKKVEGATFEEATKPASAKEIINAEKTYVRGQASNYEKVTSRGGTALMSATGNEAETKVVKDLIDENAFQYARVKNKEKYEWAVKEFVNDKEAVSKKMLKYADNIDSIPTSQIVDTHYQAHAVMKMMRSQLDNPALSAEEREAAREIYGAAASLTQQLSSLSGQVNQFQGVMVHCDGKTRMRNAVDNIANILDSSRGFRTSKTGKSLSGNAFQRKNQIRDIIYSDPDASKALEKIIDAATEEEYGDAMQELLYATSKMNRKHALDYVQTWRYLAMLGNPKTHVRNILGNVTFGGIRQLSNTNRSLIEKRLETYAKRHGLEIERHGKTSITAFAEARKANPTTTAGKTAKEWFEKNKDAILSGAKYDENVAKGSDPAMMKWLTWLSDGNGKVLEGEDNFFRSRAYKESFIKSYTQYTKDGTEITEALLERIHRSALKESQIATFNEFNSMAQVLSKWSHTTFNDSLGRKAAGWTVNAMMPFTKVPSNILKQSVNYSPIGVARGISNITNAAKTGDSAVFNRAIDELSSGLTGTAIAALGFFLGKSTDAFTTNAGSDDAAAKFKKQQGVQNYSMTFTDPKTGEKTSVTLDWLVPTSATFFAGVEMANQLKRGYADLFEFVGDMSQVTSRVIEPVLETSMLSGLYNIVEGARSGTGDDEKQNFFSLTLRELTQSYANSLVPTVQGQLSRTLYKSDKQLTGDTDWEYWMNSLKNKMGIANTNLLGTEALGADTTAYGDVKNKKESAGDYAKSALKNFLSPANIQKVDLDEMDEAKIKQYEDAVKNGADPQEMAYLFPKKQYKKEFTTGNLDVTMSNKDLSAYNQAKTTGGAEGARYALESIMFNRYTKDERGYKHSTADAYTPEQKREIIKQFEGKSIRDVEKWVREQPQFKNADEAEQKRVIDGLWSYSKQGKAQSAKRVGEQAVIKAQGGDVNEYNFNNEITEKKRETLQPLIDSGVITYEQAVDFARFAGKTYYYEDDEGGHSQTYYNKGVMLDYLKSKGYDDETAAALFNSFKAWNAKEYGKSGYRRYGRRRRRWRRWHRRGGGSSAKATVPTPKAIKASQLAEGEALVGKKKSSTSKKSTPPSLARVKAKVDLPTPKQ